MESQFRAGFVTVEDGLQKEEGTSFPNPKPGPGDLRGPTCPLSGRQNGWSRAESSRLGTRPIHEGGGGRERGRQKERGGEKGRGKRGKREGRKRKCVPERPAYLQLPITHMYNKIKKLVRTAFHVVPEVPESTNPLTFSIGYCRTSYSHGSKVKAPPLPHSGISPIVPPL